MARLVCAQEVIISNGYQVYSLDDIGVCNYPCGTLLARQARLEYRGGQSRDAGSRTDWGLRQGRHTQNGFQGAHRSMAVTAAV